MGVTHPDQSETRHPAEEYRWAVEGMVRAGEERVAAMDRPELERRPGRGDQLV